MNEQPNPYRSPSAPAPVAQSKRGAPIKAVLLGVMVDIGGSLVAGVLLTVVAALVLGALGMPADRIQEELTNITPNSWFSIAGYIVGCFFSLLGGYTCARVARRFEYRLAGIVAFISAAAGFLFGMEQYSLRMNALSSMVAVLFVMLGAWRGIGRKKRNV